MLDHCGAFLKPNGIVVYVERNLTAKQIQIFPVRMCTTVTIGSSSAETVQGGRWRPTPYDNIQTNPSCPLSPLCTGNFFLDHFSVFTSKFTEAYEDQTHNLRPPFGPLTPLANFAWVCSRSYGTSDAVSDLNPAHCQYLEHQNQSCCNANTRYKFAGGENAKCYFKWSNHHDEQNTIPSMTQLCSLNTGTLRECSLNWTAWLCIKRDPKAVYDWFKCFQLDYLHMKCMDMLRVCSTIFVSSGVFLPCEWVC